MARGRARGVRFDLEDDSLWGQRERCDNQDLPLRPTDHVFWAKRVVRACGEVRAQARLIIQARTDWLALRNAGLTSMADAAYTSYQAMTREGVALWRALQCHWDTYQLALMHDEDDGRIAA